jgi:hypothetical protein
MPADENNSCEGGEMEENPIQNDRRRVKRERMLGENAACAFCGITTPEVLLRAHRNLIDGHHAVGRANDADLIVPLCHNHHAILTESYARAGVSMHPAETVLDRFIAVLKALGAFFVALAQTCWRWAEDILRFMEWLDQRCPDWRHWRPVGDTK